jgi:hypothetical protein
MYLSAAVIAFRTGIPLASRQLHPVGNPVGEDDLPRDSTQSVQTRQRCLEVWKRAAELPTGWAEELGPRTLWLIPLPSAIGAWIGARECAGRVCCL